MADESDLFDQLNNLTPRQRGEVMEPQDVTAVVTAADYTPSKAKGTIGWTYTATMLDGPYEGEEIDGKLWFTTKAADIFTRHLTALGIELNDLKGKSNEQVAELMVGATFKGSVEINEYRGRKTNQITAIEFISNQQDIGGGDTGSADEGEGEDPLAGLDEFSEQDAPLDPIGQDQPVALEEDPVDALWNAKA